ncbi:MAG: dUTP diphosphatase [Gordonibacter sp.]|uniref:dUTP diphosphatase n=1 Tax=Gordonibacter sp. TaxID=1968902 RepID=UPI002FC76C0F
MERLSVPLKNLDPELPAPQCAYAGDGAVDLRATRDDILQPFERKLVPCGIAVAIPVGYAGFVLPRSGLAIKHGISLVNAPGLIDSNYRGEIQAVLVNLDPHKPFAIKRGDRVAQLAIMCVEEVHFESCEMLPATERGEGGFGSSGVGDRSL